MDEISTKIKWKKKKPLLHWAIPEKNKTGGWGYGISRGIKEIASMWNFQGLPRKNYAEFPGVFVFGLGISKGCNTVLHNFQGWSFDLSGISRGKVIK